MSIILGCASTRSRAPTYCGSFSFCHPVHVASQVSHLYIRVVCITKKPFCTDYITISDNVSSHDICAVYVPHVHITLRKCVGNGPQALSTCKDRCESPVEALRALGLTDGNADVWVDSERPFPAKSLLHCAPLKLYLALPPSPPFHV